MSTVAVPQAFVFMKVGNHAGETFEQILERKNKEFSKAGKIFWGYGGSACHPITQVQPFAKGVMQKHGSVYLLMEPINSKADPEVVPATEYSEDGVIWKPIPKGIEVTGSRYALVLDEIVPGDLDVSPDEFVVGVGPSRGRRAVDYLQGRIDKACLCKEEGAPPQKPSAAKQIKFMAKLLDPYAVLLK
ncbi:MAG TPA: hypothetical protein VHD36_03910 [Pirellulales bacterium]|nr:hypothetical protein [Pirellulales bacterium]